MTADHEDDMKRRISEEEQQHRTPIDPVRMFLKTLDNYHDLVDDFHDLKVGFTQHQNDIAERFRNQNDTIEGLVKRMNGQVTNTGHKNTDEIDKLKTKMARFDTQLFDEDTGLIKTFLSTRRMLRNLWITSGIGLALWVVQWWFQHFWK
jgi:hypothetical protein